MSEKLKELGQRVQVLEQLNQEKYDIYVDRNSIRIPLNLFMRGIMDDKEQLILKNNELQKQLNYAEESIKRLEDMILRLMSIKKEEKEEIEIL